MKPLQTCTLLCVIASANANLNRERKTCTVKASGSNATDDAPAIRAAFKECGQHGLVIFSPTTYYVNSVLNISGLNDVDVDIQGQLLVCLSTLAKKHKLI